MQLQYLQFTRGCEVSRDVNICTDIYTRNHLEASPLFGLTSKTRVILGSKNTNSTDTIPSWRSPERNLAIVMIISDLPWRLSKHLEDFLRFLGEALGRGEVLHRMSSWNLLYPIRQSPWLKKRTWCQSLDLGMSPVTAGCSHSWWGMWHLTVSPFVWEESYSYFQKPQFDG